MKIVFGIAVLLGILIVAFGSPVAKEKPVRDYHYGSLEPILPMNFAHLDHANENCVLCHHNYVDDTGGGLCMNCQKCQYPVCPFGK